MKQLNNLFLVLFSLVAFAMSSCDKDVETSPVSVDLSQKATITGYVYAETNLTDEGLEPVSANVKIILSIPNSDFTPGAKGNWIDTVKTDATGKFIATVPTIAAGVNVTVSTTDFIADQTQSLVDHYAAISMLYTGEVQSSIKVKPGESKIKIYNYSDPEVFSDFDNFVTITGKVFAETNNNNSVNESAPAVDIIFSADGWSKKVTLVKGVKYTTFTVDVPKSMSIYYSYDFTFNKYVDDNGWKEVLYRYNTTEEYLSYYYGDTEDADFNLGGGQKVE